MQTELSLVLAQMERHGGYSKTQSGKTETYTGRIGDHEIVAMQCGIGKVNAAMRTQRMLEDHRPDLVINSGVAGGVDASMRIGEVLVPDRVAYHDVWCGPGTKYGEADGFPLYFRPREQDLEVMKGIAAQSDDKVKFGLLCSGDKFISTPAEVEEIKSHFADALGCDMESGAIAQACAEEGVPFLVIRVMSDMPGGGENISEYRNFWNDAPEKTFKTVSDFIKAI